MSIEKNKIKKIVNEVIKENLVVGYVPTSDEVILQISDIISKQNIKDPFYDYENKRSFKVEDLNETKTLIKKDVDLLFESLFDIYNLTKMQAEKIQAEKEKQEKRLNELEATLEQLSLKYSVAGYISGYINSLSTISSFDVTNTNAFIDTQNREMTLQRNENIIVEEYNISIIGGDKIQSNGDINSLTRSTGFLWSGFYSTLEKNQKSSLIILVKLNKPSNVIKFDMPMIKPCGIEIYEGELVGEYQHVLTGTIDGNLSAQIKSSSKYIKIILTKDEADKFDATSSRYYFYYLIDTIKIYSSKYLLSSSFRTKEIIVPEEINSIYLSVEEEIPSSCKIDYYVSSNAEQWFPIQNNSILNRNIINYNIFKRFANTTDRSISSFIDKNNSTSNLNLYRLGSIENTSIINPKLYKGADCWKQSLLLHQAPVDGIISKKYFIDQKLLGRTPIVSYLPIISSQAGYVYNSTSFPAICALETRITLEKGEDSVEKRTIIHSYPITIYLNGTIIYESLATSIPVKITWPFKKGKNTIEIYTNISEANVFVPTTQNILTIYLGMDMLKNNYNRYGEENLSTEMSLSNLQYNSIGKSNAYCLLKETNGYGLLLNSPDVYVPYKLIYNSLNGGSNSLYVGGTLSSPNPKLTPKVKLIEVRYSKS